MKRKMNRLSYGCFFTILTVLAFLSITPLSYAAPADLDVIRSAINAKGAKWVAGENQFSRLSPQEKKQWLGLLDGDEPESADYSSYDTAPETSATTAPSTLDWRNVDGVSYVSPVKNQGNCGSCWAFAVTAGLESQIMLTSGGAPADLSEQILLSCSGAGSCSGGYTTTASNFIRDVGLPVENCFKYTAQNTSCDSACLDWRYNTYMVVGWHRTKNTPATVDDIRTSLNIYGPVVVSYDVYNDFYSYKGGVYSYTTGSYVGGHAVLAVGYDDVDQYFIVKNSWGATWGESGYFRIAYSEVTGTTRFGRSVIVYDGYGEDPPPAPTSPCSYSLSSTGGTFKSDGGNGSVSVSTQSNCAWTAAVNNASWVRITSGSSGTGNATVSYTVDANTTTSSREATLTIAGMTYRVSQAGVTYTSCSYFLSSVSQSFTADRGKGSVNVSSASNCAWTAAVNDASWVRITSGSSGTGDAAVTYSVEANKSNSSREATLTIAGITYKVSQAGKIVTMRPTVKDKK